MDRLVVDVQAQLAARLWDQAYELENRAQASREAGHHETAARLTREARAHRDVARVALQRAGVDTAPSKRVPLTDDEIAEREQAGQEFALAALRADRNALLAASDWTQAADAPVDQKAWADYRQQLRDLPAGTDNPAAPDWPTPPS